VSGDLLARAGVGVPSPSTGRHPVEILTADAERDAQLLFGTLAGRAVASLEICDDPSMTAEEKVAAIRRTLAGGGQ
jgi:hypothetical protein